MVEDLDILIQKIKNESDAFSKARYIKHLNKDKGIRIKEIAELLGVKSSYVCNLIRIVKLPEIIVDSYYGKTLSLSHLIVLSRIKDPNKVITAFEHVLAKNMSITATENLVRETLYGISNKGERLGSDEIARLKNQLEKMDKNIMVNVVQTRIRSKIIFEIKGNLEKTTQGLRTLIESIVR